MLFSFGSLRYSGGMISGMIHILGVGDGNLLIVFTSEHGTGSHPVANREGAEHFIVRTLGCTLKAGEMDRLMAGQSPNGVEARISVDQYEDYFSK